MSDAEYSFLEDMRTERKQFCEDFIDNMWEKTKEKQSKRIQQLQQRDSNLSKAKKNDEDRMA